MFKWFSGMLNAPMKFLGMLDKPSERGGVIIKLGLMLYDAYTKNQGTVPVHNFRRRKSALVEFPQLNPDAVCTATYYDGAMHTPERICMELISDAQAASSKARAINYLCAESATGGEVTLYDEISGEQYNVRPQIVINAAGPWIDFANQALGQKTRFIGGTKGSHLVLDYPELRTWIGENEFFFENHDGRIVLIYPLLDKVMIGTSDIRLDDPDQARCTDEEINYFFGMVQRVFPQAKLDRSQIVFQFAGVRPLPASDANTTGQISRDHSIRVVEPDNGIDFPVYNLIGGKWTTFRAFSEQAADQILARLGQTRVTNTRNTAIGGGANYPQDSMAKSAWVARVQQETGLSADQITTLFDRYGTRSELIAQTIVDSADSVGDSVAAQSLVHKPDYYRGEITFLAQQEQVAHLDDLILRRSMLGILGQLTPELLAELVDILGDTLSWTSDQQQAEIRRTYALLKDHHGVDFS